MLELSKWGDDDIFRGVFVLTVHLTSHMTWKMASHMCIHKGMQGQDMRTKGSTRPHHHNTLHFNSPFPFYHLLISGCVYLRKYECRFVDLAPPTEQCPESCLLALIGTPPAITWHNELGSMSVSPFHIAMQPSHSVMDVWKAKKICRRSKSVWNEPHILLPFHELHILLSSVFLI